MVSADVGKHLVSNITDRLIGIIARYTGFSMPMTHRDEVFLIDHDLVLTLDEQITQCPGCDTWLGNKEFSIEEVDGELLCISCFNENNS